MSQHIKIDCKKLISMLKQNSSQRLKKYDMRKQFTTYVSRDNSLSLKVNLKS